MDELRYLNEVKKWQEKRLKQIKEELDEIEQDAVYMESLLMIFMGLFFLIGNIYVFENDFQSIFVALGFTFIAMGILIYAIHNLMTKIDWDS